MFRSEMRPCKACDETSGSSDSDILGIRIQETTSESAKYENALRVVILVVSHLPIDCSMARYIQRL